MNQNMYNNKINNPIPAYLDKDNTFIQEDNRINPLVYMHVTENKSPREWLRDVKFAENAYLTPEMQITGDGAKNYQKALDKVSNFKTKVRPVSQDDYQRDMYFEKFNTNEVDRLIYLNNALDAAWNNKKNTFKNDRQYNKAYNKYVEQKNTIYNNLKNIDAAADKIVSNERWMDEFNRLGHVWNTQVFPTLIGTTMLAGYSSPWASVGSSAAMSGSAAASAAAYSIPRIAWESIRKAATDPRTYVSIFGGMAADEATKLLSDGKYQGVSDYIYQESGLKDLTEDTWAEDPAKFVTNMANPAYYLPYGKIANATGSLIDDGLRAAQSKGFFTPSSGVPANALHVRLLPFSKWRVPSLNKVKNSAAKKNIEITKDIGNLTDDELKALQKYVNYQPSRQGEPMRYIFKKDGQFKYDHGMNTDQHVLDLNNIQNYNTGPWNWMKNHKLLTLLGIGLASGHLPYLAGKVARNIADADENFEKGFSDSEPSEPSKPTEQIKLPDIPIGFAQDSIYTW